jgi:hypothetical protein
MRTEQITLLSVGRGLINVQPPPLLPPRTRGEPSKTRGKVETTSKTINLMLGKEEPVVGRRARRL